MSTIESRNSTPRSGSAVDLSTWMSDLPDTLKDLPLIHLAIPGSHDSMTYGITKDSTISPDAEPVVKKASLLCHGTIRRWAITQDHGIQEQLRTGIRYLDFRIATRKPSTDFYFVHGLYAQEITQSLEDIRNFLDSHRQEVVIIDCQHFYAFYIEDHLRLREQLHSTFAYRICPNNGDISKCTLNSLTNKRQQVILIYRRNVASSSIFWPSDAWLNPWPQESSVTKLVNKLKVGLRDRPPSKGYVTQCVVTPTTGFILLRLRATLKEKCAKPVAMQVYPWVSEQSPGPSTPGEHRVNVVMADFVEMNNSGFCKMIVELNKKIKIL